MWNSVGCEIQGRGHLKTGTPCQDKIHSLCDSDISIVALADGAGSVSHSHYGAERITRFMCHYLYDEFDSFYSNPDGVLVKRIIIEAVLNELDQLANEHECEIKDLASTLLVVGVSSDRYIIIHIGDGVIGYYKNNKISVASAPENGEFTNSTVFTSSPDALAKMKILKGEVNSIGGFVLMSDGPESSLYDKRKKSLANALKRVVLQMQIGNITDVEKRLQNSFETVIRNNTTDDCSIVFLVNRLSNISDYFNWNYEEKATFWGMRNLRNGHVIQKRINKVDYILALLNKPHTVNELSRRLHIKPIYTRRCLKILCDSSLVVEDHGRYYSLLNRIGEME